MGTKTYDTYLLEPEIEHIGGVFKKSKNANLKLWVTADNRRFPVRVESQLSVGSFVGELISIEGPDPEIKKLKEKLEKKEEGTGADDEV